jgi:hypothetical protein
VGDQNSLTKGQTVQPQVSGKAVKAAIAEMERWGITPPYLLAAVQDALVAAFAAQAAYDEATAEPSY